MKHNQIKIGKKVFTVSGNLIGLLNRYKNNKKVSAGSKIQCTSCLNEIIKIKESYVFCGLSCKDDFWNKIDPRKRNRNGKNRSSDKQNSTSTSQHWCDDDLSDCGYHNK